MKRTVEEILTMYSDNKLRFNQSTQRDFIYNDSADYAKSKEDPELSCAGDVIKTILEGGFLSPVVFWQTPDMPEDTFNVHDGKQRLLSVINFVNNTVSTKLADGSSVSGGFLAEYHEDLFVQLLSFEFDIQVRYGDDRYEERSFFKTNTTGIPLTEYEGLKGSYHGNYFTTFEAFLEGMHLRYPDCIKAIGRGDQAIWPLYLALDCIDDDLTYTSSDPKAWQLLQKAKSKLALCRNATFDPKLHRVKEKLELYCRLVKEGRLHKGDAAKQAAKVYRIANYIINNNYDQNLIVSYFSKYNTDAYRNDIGSWKFNKEIKHAIQMLLDGRTPDPLRYFGNWKAFQQLKYDLWAALPATHECPGYTELNGTVHTCSHIFTSIEDTEMDHIIPYDLGMENGGVTDATNVQLVCESCNSKKRNK
jgi:hypothetical protein